MKHSVLICAVAAFVLSHAVDVNAQQRPGPKVADAKPGDVRMIVTAAIRGPLDSVLPQATKAVGKPIVVEYGSARGNLKDTILGGQDFEVAILLPDVNEQLLKAGKIKPGTYRIATVDVALGLRGDVPDPDVSTPAALKATLLKAKSVKYAPTGAALNTVQKILSTLDVAASIKDSSKLKDPVELAAGEYEINIYPISEIIPNKALKNMGPVIKPLQVPAVIEAVIGAHANDPAAALATIKFLQGSAIDPGLAAAGMKKAAHEN
jgi:molybdate transport system substrate-binding protein